MQKKHYDVAVIGAGPAGSLCARNLAAKGYEVLLLEKRPVVGVPVRCGEATGTRSRLSQFTDINENWIETDLHGVILHGTGGVTTRYDKPNIGLMLDRAKFDQDLAEQARKAGAELVLSARVSGIGEVIEKRRKLIVHLNGTEQHITASVVVGADGAEALSGRWIGLNTLHKPPEVCSAIEFRLDAVDQNPNHLTFWHGHDAINNGYVWIFPKVRSKVVNLGAGQLTPKMGSKNIQDITEEYRQRYFPQAKIVEVHGGAVPVSGTVDKTIADNFLLIGDAAHHTNPLTGGGIMAGICSGDFAAAEIDKAFKMGSLNEAAFEGYVKACWTQFGEGHLKQKKIRNFVLNLDRQAQISFYRAFKGMAEADLSFGSKIKGYLKLALLVAKNWAIFKKAQKTK